MAPESNQTAAVETALEITGSAADFEREKELSDVPAAYRHLYRSAWTGRSRKAAIRAFCLACVGWQPKEVRNCTALTCPLYEFRLRG